MEYIDIYCLKSILKESNHKDLINWRLVCKRFKNIIDDLDFNVDFYTACEKGYYISINKYLKTDFFDYNKALKFAIKGENINVIKLLLKYGAKKVDSTIFNVQNIEIIKLLLPYIHRYRDIGLYIACKNKNLDL